MMTERRLISSGSPYEPLIGFSRAVRVGAAVYVSGTVAWGDDGKLAAPGDVYGQARQAIRNIEKALAEAGAAPDHVVRQRIFVTAIPLLVDPARAHGEAVGPRPPGPAMVQGGA